MSDRLEPLKTFLETPNNKINKTNNMIEARKYIQIIYDELKQYDTDFLDYMNTIPYINDKFKVLFSIIDKKSFNDKNIVILSIFLTSISPNNIYNTMLSNMHNAIILRIITAKHISPFNMNKKIIPHVKFLIEYIKNKNGLKPVKYPVPNAGFLDDYEKHICETFKLNLINSSSSDNHSSAILKKLKTILESLQKNNTNMIDARKHIQKIYDELKQYDEHFLDLIEAADLSSYRLIMRLITIINDKTFINNENDKKFLEKFLIKVEVPVENDYKSILVALIHKVIDDLIGYCSSIAIRLPPSLEDDLIEYIKNKNNSKKYLVPNEELVFDYMIPIIKPQIPITTRIIECAIPNPHSANPSNQHIPTIKKKQIHNTSLINASAKTSNQTIQTITNKIPKPPSVKTSNQTIQTITNNIFPLLSAIAVVLVIVVGIVMGTKEGFCMNDDPRIFIFIVIVIFLIYRYV